MGPEMAGFSGRTILLSVFGFERVPASRTAQRVCSKRPRRDIPNSGYPSCVLEGLLLRLGSECTLVIYFEDIEIGKVRTAGPFELTKREIVDFAKKWDPLPFHIDEKAAKESVFGGFSASGSLKIAIANRLLYDMEPPAVIAALAHEYSYPNPAMAGDILHIESTNVEKTDSTSQPEKRGMVRGETLLKNQDGVVVLEMKSLVMVERRPRV